MVSDCREFSFEFFPPKTDQGLAQLSVVAQSLSTFDPAYCSVTFGAGGSVQSRTQETVAALQSTISVAVVPHISCVGGTCDVIRAILRQYQDQGVNRLVVLRGDLPQEQAAPQAELPFARDLVAFIRAEFADAFDISVACYPESHPESDHAQADFDFFRQKVEAGANRAITQYFYNIEAYERFLERVQQANLQLPIVPGIMPIHNLESLQRFSRRCGADLPQWLLKELAVYQDDVASMRLKGIEIVTRLCDQLLQLGAPGLHFYTLNQTDATTAIIKNCHSLGYVSVPQVVVG